MHSTAIGSNVHVLSQETVVIAGVRFAGCTLWTDFQLEVLCEDGSMQTDVARSMRVASIGLNDFRCIERIASTKSQHRDRQRPVLLSAADTLAMHWIERDWLRRVLKTPFEGPTVVVSHHAPSRQSTDPNFVGDPLTPAFVSDLPGEFFRVPQLWIHGHTHASADYRIGDCRVVSNPRGYTSKDGKLENLRFDPGLVIEISADGLDAEKS